MSPAERIVFLDRESIRAEFRRPGFPHEWIEYPRTSDDEIVSRLAPASIAVTNKVPLYAETLARLPALRLIAVCATGTNNVDLDYCRRHGIAVSNIRDYAVHTVPEHVFMLILALRRNLAGYMQDVAAGRWQRSDQFCLFTHPIADIHGSTLGIVGFGTLGRAVAALARAFDMEVLIAEHKGADKVRPGFVPFTQALERSHVLSLHVPLTPRTRGLIGRDELARMRPDALLINCARGGVVDEQALADSLRAGAIAGAGIDVLSEEPPRRGSPLLMPDVPNLIVTPHVAWSSRQAMQIMADQLIDNIEAFVQGAPRNLVT